MTNQHLRDNQIGFLQRCSECFLIVQDFLHDRLHCDILNGVWTSDTHRNYQFDPELRDSVKSKVVLSMEKLESSIDLHGYVFMVFQKKCRTSNFTSSQY